MPIIMKAATYHKIVNMMKNKTFFEIPVLYYRTGCSYTAEGADEYIRVLYYSIYSKLIKITKNINIQKHKI